MFHFCSTVDSVHYDGNPAAAGAAAAAAGAAVAVSIEQGHSANPLFGAGAGATAGAGLLDSSGSKVGFRGASCVVREWFLVS